MDEVRSQSSDPRTKARIPSRTATLNQCMTAFIGFSDLNEYTALRYSEKRFNCIVAEDLLNINDNS